jgi:hypothetical protein
MFLCKDLSVTNSPQRQCNINTRLFKMSAHAPLEALTRGATRKALFQFDP